MTEPTRSDSPEQPITRGELQRALQVVIGRLENDYADNPRRIEDHVHGAVTSGIAVALERLMDELGLDRFGDV